MNIIVNYKKIRTDIINVKRDVSLYKTKKQMKGKFVLLSVYIKSIVKNKKVVRLVYSDEGYISKKEIAKVSMGRKGYYISAVIKARWEARHGYHLLKMSIINLIIM